MEVVVWRKPSQGRDYFLSRSLVSAKSRISPSVTGLALLFFLSLFFFSFFRLSAAFLSQTLETSSSMKPSSSHSGSAASESNAAQELASVSCTTRVPSGGYSIEKAPFAVGANSFTASTNSSKVVFSSTSRSPLV
eukprot:15150_1